MPYTKDLEREALLDKATEYALDLLLKKKTNHKFTGARSSAVKLATKKFSTKQKPLNWSAVQRRVQKHSIHKEIGEQLKSDAEERGRPNKISNADRAAEAILSELSDPNFKGQKTGIIEYYAEKHGVKAKSTIMQKLRGNPIYDAFERRATQGHSQKDYIAYFSEDHPRELITKEKMMDDLNLTGKTYLTTILTELIAHGHIHKLYSEDPKSYVHPDYAREAQLQISYDRANRPVHGILLEALNNPDQEFEESELLEKFKAKPKNIEHLLRHSTPPIVRTKAGKIRLAPHLRPKR